MRVFYWNKRRTYVSAILAAGLAVLLVVAYALVLHRIRSELTALARTRFGGELKDVSISYRPPYGLVLRNLHVVTRESSGRERDLLKVNRLDVRFDGRPGANGPVRVRSLELDEPVVRVVAHEPIAAGPQMSSVLTTPTTMPGLEPGPVLAVAERPKPTILPATLSDKIQIGRLKITGGSVWYEDRGRLDRPPIEVKGINLDVGPPSRPGRAQAFTIAAGGEGGRIEAAGTLETDGLVLELSRGVIDVERGKTAALPGFLAGVVERYRVGGKMVLAGTARFPLREIDRKSFDATAELLNATVGVPGSDVTATGVNFKLAVSNRVPATQPATGGSVPPTRVQLVAFNAKCGENTLVLTGGEFTHDPAGGAWKVAQLAGTLQTPYPAAEEITGPAIPAAAKSTRPAGRVDFTAFASGPIRIPDGKRWSDVVKYELLAYPRDAVWRPGKKWPLPLDHLGGGGSIRVANGVAEVRDLTGTYGGDRLRLAGLRVPLPKDDLSELWTLETRIEEIAATLTCYQPGPVYPDDVQSEFALLHPEGTFQINGWLTLRHDRPAPGGPKPKDDFFFEVAGDGNAAFAVTDKRIPLTQLRGKGAISPLLVRIDPTEAHCLGGTLTAEGNITPRSHDTPMMYDGKVWVRGVDMALLAPAVDLRGGDRVQRLTGRGFLDVTFAGTGGKAVAQSLRANGELQILGCHFWDDPVLGKVASDVRSGKAAGSGDAAAVFAVASGRVTLREAAINSPSVGLAGSGTIGFDKQLDLNVVAVPLGDLRDKLKQSGVPVLGDIAGEVAGLAQGVVRTATGSLLYQYRVTGSATQPAHAIVPAPILSDPVAALFGDMARGRGNNRLLDAVKATAEPAAARVPGEGNPPPARRGN